jgi:hypothetical protein
MDLFSTNSLVAVIKELREPSTFLLDRFFPNQLNDPSEEIHFDIDKSKPRITPFCSPLVAGKVVNSKGFRTATFKPAYAKDKRVWQPNKPLKRVIGEKLGGSLTPDQRIALLLGQELDDQLQMLTRREVVMASEALRTGKVTVSGEQFPTTVVDFERAAALTIQLAANDRWSIVHADSNPLIDLEDWATLVQNEGGGVITDWVMDPKAWQLFRDRIVQRGEAESLFNWMRASTSSSADFAPNNGQIARLVANLSGVRYWVYQELYEDDAGASQKMLPDNTVIGASSVVEGTRCYAAIQDPKANYTADRFFTKSWIDEDPAVRWLLLQSAPLVVPFRPNATVCATVV